MGMGSPVTPPKNEGTGEVAYQPHTETSAALVPSVLPQPGAIDQFEHISAQKEYRRWSPEELRAEDYASNKKWGLLQSIHLLDQLDYDIESTLSDLHDSRTSTLGKLTAPAPIPHHGHLPGIPHSPPLSAHTASEEAHQLALLNLCLLSETLCWDALSNRAMSAYLLGEATLPPARLPHRPDPQPRARPLALPRLRRRQRRRPPLEPRRARPVRRPEPRAHPSS
jgi:hypothetical protein